MPLFFPSSFNKQALAEYGLRAYSNKDAEPDQLRFNINIPAAFKLVKQMKHAPSINIPVVDCVYFKSEQEDIEVIVQCAHLQYEVSLEHYYEYTAKQNGETVVEKRLIGENEEKPDMLIQRSFPDGQTWITRRTGYKIWNGQGAFVLTVNASTSQENYVRYAELLYAIASSLTPLTKPDWQLAERLLMVSRRYPVDFATYIPISWKEYHHHSDSMDEMNLVYTKTLRKAISGMLSMCCIAEYKVGGKDAVLQKCHKGYIDQGVDFSNMKTTKIDDIQAFSSVIKGYIDFPQQKDNDKIKNNLTFYLAKKGNNWMYLEMFGPSKETDYEAWSLNDRAFEIMRDKIVTI